MSQTWQLALETDLGLQVVSKQELSGGDFATAFAIELSNGSRLFVKTHQNPPPHFFTTEATGLGWLRDTQTVRVPEVLAVSDDPPYLALEWIEHSNSQASAKSDQQLGIALAALHQLSAESFGRPDQRTTGSLAVPNKTLNSWADFYASQRLLPLAKIAQERQALSATECEAVIEIASSLDKIDIANDAPSLLHGDLWAGNRVVDKHGVSWLVDPAAHCGHREFDLAMMQLFGGYSEHCFSAYHEAYPLLPGFADRVLLHQLAPLIVHAIKFGGSYRSGVQSAIESSKALI